MADEEFFNTIGYKLFFHRTRRQIPVKRLSQETGIDARLINNLEQVKTKVSAGPKCFKSAPRSDLAKIEHALGCVGALEYGQSDDFLATYMMYYKVNKNPVRGSTTNQVMDFASGTKAVVFDFGGTLTRSNTSLSTWERMWTAVGYTTKEAGHYHRRFLSKSITHQEWCDVTAVKLKERGFSKQHLNQVAASITLLDGVKETIRILHENDIALYIVSGSVREIIAKLLGDEFALFTEVRANKISFDDQGLIRSIKGHRFDFEGKADFVRRVIKDQACHPLEVLFVGNSLNDTWASQSGARTLCVNPADVDYTNTFVWTDYIRDMGSLTEILPYAIKQEASEEIA